MMVPWLQYINSVWFYEHLLVSYLFIFSCSFSTVDLSVFVAHLKTNIPQLHTNILGWLQQLA